MWPLCTFQYLCNYHGGQINAIMSVQGIARNVNDMLREKTHSQLYVSHWQTAELSEQVQQP